MKESIQFVAEELGYSDEWASDDMGIFVKEETREKLFAEADRQGISLFKEENLEVLAALLEWALERKLHRVFMPARGRKTIFDMMDVITLLTHLRVRNGGPLDMESIRTLNANGFDPLPDYETMRRVSNE